MRLPEAGFRRVWIMGMPPTTLLHVDEFFAGDQLSSAATKRRHYIGVGTADLPV